MNLSNVRLALLACLVALAVPSAGVAQDKPPGAPDVAARSDLGFLELGKAYFVKFPEDRHPILTRESGSEITKAVATTESGEKTTMSVPMTWSMKYQVNVFVVRKLGGGSWVLLEHPVDPKKALDFIMAKHVLADQAQVAEMEKTKEGKSRLAELRKDAGAEIKTAQTWINLAHAISISDPPPDSPDNWKVDIQVKSISHTGK